MTIAVFGGSGATGRAVIDALLAEDHELRALCRRAASLAPHRGLTVIKGELSDAEAIGKTVQQSSAVLILFGPRLPYRDIFCADATAAIIAAMQQAGISRLTCQTGSMIGDYPANRSWLMRRICALFNRRYPALAADRSRQERIVMESGLQWTLLKPPRLTDGSPGRLACGEELRVGMLSAISRRSIAAWIMQELKSPEHLQQLLFLRRR